MATKVDDLFTRVPISTDDERYAAECIREHVRPLDEATYQSLMARVAKSAASGVVGLILDLPRYVERPIGHDDAWQLTTPFFFHMLPALILLASDQSPDLEIRRRRAAVAAELRKASK